MRLPEHYFALGMNLALMGFATNPRVSGRPFIRFYAAARFTVRSETVDTLCAYGIRPTGLCAVVMGSLRTLASAAIELIGQRGAAFEYCSLGA
jgi:hypothetical protein